MTWPHQCDVHHNIDSGPIRLSRNRLGPFRIAAIARSPTPFDQWPAMPRRSVRRDTHNCTAIRHPSHRAMHQSHNPWPDCDSRRPHSGDCSIRYIVRTTAVRLQSWF